MPPTPLNPKNQKNRFSDFLVQDYAQTSYVDAPDAGKILPDIFEKHDFRDLLTPWTAGLLSNPPWKDCAFGALLGHSPGPSDYSPQK